MEDNVHKSLAVLLAVMLSTSPLAAQEFNAPTIVLTDANASVGVLGLTVEQTVGMDLYDSEEQSVGKVVRVLGDDQDTPTALAVDLGTGVVIIDLANTELINNRIIAALTADEIAALPRWEQ